ncbi:hypothetical protein ZWY2020_017683 [Hordeum vulgare]|nr:hypothetical protein ZWY2020_017683 [Hordeum vulgare]
MDAVDSVVDPLHEFAKDSVRLVKRCHKPDHKGKDACACVLPLFSDPVCSPLSPDLTLIRRTEFTKVDGQEARGRRWRRPHQPQGQGAGLMQSVPRLVFPSLFLDGDTGSRSGCWRSDPRIGVGRVVDLVSGSLFLLSQ